MEIAPGIHQLRVPIPDNPLGYLNSYIVQGENGWLMIDTGWYTPEAFDSLIAGLKSLGLTLTDISTIVVTHVHPDHFGLAGRIKQLSPKTQLLTHRWESDLIESRYIKFSELQNNMDPMLRRHGVPSSDLQALRSASMPILSFVTVTLPDQIFYGGEIVDTGKYELEIIWTPGHSPGHICLYEPKNQLLFSGDHILPSISPNISYHVQSGDDPLGDYLRALRKLAHLPVNKVLPAHEQVFNDLKTRIMELLEHHKEREGEIKQVIGKKSSHAYETSSQLTWHVHGLSWEQFPPFQKRAAVTETIAHLEHMRWEGMVKKIVMGGNILYSVL